MKLNDTIENKEEARGAVAKLDVEKTVAASKPVTPKKTTSSVVIAEENLEQLIPQWKAKYGKIFKNTIDDSTYVIWRPLKRGEYKALLNEGEESEIFLRQEETCKIAILYPSNAEELVESRAGLATVLSEEILKFSGFEISETQSL